MHRAPLSRQRFQLPASTDGDEAGAGVERAGGHLQRLVGVARVRDCERERARPDETRRTDLLEHDHGTGNVELATAASTSPAIPDPPMPSTTTSSMSSGDGSATASSTVLALRWASASCSGSPPTASRNPIESGTR